MTQRLFPNSLSRLMLLVVLCAFIGAAFSLATAQTENILHRFNPNSSTDGNDPGSGLVADKAGNLYGTTRQGGGTADCGIAYEMSPPAAGGTVWMETILHDFAGGTDGCLPIGALAIDKNGNLHGTTAHGGGDLPGVVVIALHSPNAQLETGLHKCPPEKIRDSDPIFI
jgi:hypothetical protein